MESRTPAGMLFVVAYQLVSDDNSQHSYMSENLSVHGVELGRKQCFSRASIFSSGRVESGAKRRIANDRVANRDIYDELHVTTSKIC